jgi:predicted metal-binding membrane protein
MGLARQDLVLILACIATITLLAWAYLFHLDRQMSPAIANDKMMAAMGMASNTPWTATDLFFTFTMWAVMMAGMMGPSAAPMLLVFGAARSNRKERGASLSTGLFGLGYVAVWTAFSACAAVAQWGLHQTALLSDSMSVLSPRIGAAVLIVAGAYQLSPWKNRCLAHCRTPLNFLIVHWRDGDVGAFEMGASHGVYCLGCCWALMCILFVVGVMNLAWVALLAAFVLIEKIAPYGSLVARVSGVALVAYGVLVLV